MSYQVLARKWRPRRFTELMGQEHVVRALVNGLENNRLHHAFLFTGTRGVGKTTIARILAKSLNCETGITADPCGECAVCQDVDGGRFFDLIEVDAASRTGVDDMRELLDNVQYAPSRGRFKVYLIDEVHMLSISSFNALLKTLEEPPAHVKFILATTDPQKIPPTVLSRCLQFHLKRLSVEQIVNQLERIIQAESIEADAAGLRRLGRAADGSMRDALSLMDQAIAHGGGSLSDETVRDMLGSVDSAPVLRLLEALANRDAAALLNEVEQLAEGTPHWQALLQEIALGLHRIALLQQLPALAEREMDEALQALAERLAPEEVQLYYDIAVDGRAKLYLAPDARTGAEMTLLRMHAFAPQAFDAEASPAPPVTPAAAPARRSTPAAANTTPPPAAAPSGSAPAADTMPPTQPPATPQAPAPEPASPSGPTQPAREAAAEQMPAAIPASEMRQGEPMSAQRWAAVVQEMRLHGPTQMFASHCSGLHLRDNQWHLDLDPTHQHLLGNQMDERLAAAINQYFNTDYKLRINVSEEAFETPHAIADARQASIQAEAEQAVASDPVVQDLEQQLGGMVRDGSIRPNQQS
jgi:DNA polymerase-3 subunit gamma/tau